MKAALDKPSRRAIRSAKQRTEPNPTAKSKIALLVKSLEKRPRDAIQRWKDYLKDIKTGEILDNLRAQKLEKKLANIPLRTIKDA